MKFSTAIEPVTVQQQALLLLKFLAQGDRELKDGKGIGHRQAKQHFQETIARLKRG